MQNSDLHQQYFYNGCCSMCVTDVCNGKQLCVWPQMHTDAHKCTLTREHEQNVQS